MRVTLSDARDSPLAAGVLVLGLAAAAIAITWGGDGWGAPPDSPLFWIGVAAVPIAVVATLYAEYRRA